MFITFEGIEGSGKSSALAQLATYLEKKSFDVRLTREPGGSALGRTLRHVLLDARNTSLSSRAELFLFLADRAQHIKDIILPALEEGEIVLCDRYMDSTFVYQGAGRGMDIDRLRLLNEHAIGGMIPDLTLLFDVPVQVGLARAARRNEEEGTVISEGRFEAESIRFHTRVREGYLQLAAEEPERIVIIDATQNPDDVLLQCISAIEKKLHDYGRL
ncbi:MAG: dTMP kinase [Desulfovibrionaceae bacterium]|nr:dTMP kinase [Desulfovibrionaceae bacterium]